jgi:hypothetical protein
MKTFQVLCTFLVLLLVPWGSASAQKEHNKHWEFPIEWRAYPAGGDVSILTAVNVNYCLVPRVWIGAGAGLDMRQGILLIGSSMNCPVYGSLQVYPFGGKYSHFFVYGNGGYSFWGDSMKLGNTELSSKNSGVTGEVGLGWRSTFFRWPGVNFRLGYHVRRVNFADKDVYYMNGETVEEDPSFWRKSISIGVGIIF